MIDEVMSYSFVVAELYREKGPMSTGGLAELPPYIFRRILTAYGIAPPPPPTP